MFLDQLNRSHSTSHPLISTVTTSINKLSVDTPVIFALPTQVQNYNTTFLTLQHGQCAICGQLKSTHPEGCPQYGKFICSACERPWIPNLMMNSFMSSCFEAKIMISFLTIFTGLNLQVPPTLMTGTISTLTLPLIYPFLLVLHPPATLPSKDNDEKWKIEY